MIIRRQEVITLRHMYIRRWDLYGKNRYYNNTPHISVSDDPREVHFIRLADTYDPKDAELERKIKELTRFRGGYVVDIDVEPIDWEIDKRKGTSYLYIAIRKAEPLAS